MAVNKRNVTDLLVPHDALHVHGRELAMGHPCLCEAARRLREPVDVAFERRVCAERALVRLH